MAPSPHQKQKGPEGRTGPAGHGPQCLTLLSEPTRKLALWAVCLPAVKAHKRRLRHTETAGPWRTDRACRPRPPLPNVAFWTDKKTSSLSCLPAAKAHKRRLRHTETAGPWRTDRACGPRPPLPNVAFWTYKKTSCLSCLPAAKAHKRRLRHTETAGPWRTDRACARPPLPNVAFWTDRKLALWAVFQPPRLTNGAFATPKQQGPEGRTGPAGHGLHCLTLLSAPTRKLALWAVFQPPRLTNGAFATPKQQALKDGPGLRATAPTA